MLSTTKLRSASTMRGLVMPTCGHVALPSTQVAGSFPWHNASEDISVKQSSIFADKRENLGYPRTGGTEISLS